MKKTYNLLVVMLFAMASITYAQPVDVTNGNFEDGIEEGWGKDIGGGATGEFLEETEDVQDGEKALKAYVDGLGADPWSMQFKNETFTVEKNKTYMLSIWAKDISEGDDTVAMNFTNGMTNAVDTWHEGTRLDNHVLAKEWTEYRIYFKPAAEDIDNALFAYMSLHLVHVGVALFDNFTVTETQTKVVSAMGNTAVVEFIEMIADPAGNEANFEVKVNGAANAVTAIALDAEDATKVILTLTDEVAEGAEVVVTYTPGTLATTTGTEILEFTLSSTGDGDGGTAIRSKAKKDQISLYPNPTKDFVSFDVENVKTVEVYNVTGKLVKSVNANVNRVNVSDLNNGVYFMVIKNAQGKMFTNKLIVE